MTRTPAIDLDLMDEVEAVGSVKTAPALTAMKSGPELSRFEARVAALAARTTPDLSPAFETCTDPAIIWPLHLELHRRGIPPILRGPRHQLGEQGRFLDFAADVMWLQKVHSYHKPRYRRLAAVFDETPGSASWHSLLLEQFISTPDVRGMVIALGLKDDQRIHLRSLQTAAVRQSFENLHGARFGQLVDALVLALKERPDKSGQTRPHETASRRARMWRVHQLTGQNYATTAKTWELITGEARTRQKIERQILATAPVAARLKRQWSAEAPYSH